MNRFRNPFISIFFVLCASFQFTSAQTLQISSPNAKIKLTLTLKDGTPYYSVNREETEIIKPSKLGFVFKDQKPLNGNFKIEEKEESTFNDTWTQPWGEVKDIRNHYNELRVMLEETTELNRRLVIVFRVFDDGIGFRYEFPEQENLRDVVIMDENTEFHLTGDHLAWWIPGDWDIYEHLYNTTKISSINAISKRNHAALAQTYIPENAVNTPVTMKTADGLYLSFHEANLTNYSGMTLKVDTKNFILTSELVGSADSSKVKVSTPFVTAWRTIQIAEKAGDLIESNLILNLNEPNKLPDISWIKPMKYIGIWWELHLGKSTWDMASGRHGATTQNAKRYIDFATENGIDGVLIEGWNTGWEHWFGFEEREGVFDFVTPYTDYNLDEVTDYAQQKDVNIIMHHETGAAPRFYELQLDTAFALCQKYGIHVVKTGYVQKVIPKGEYHHGQWMVNHYRKVLEKAAEYEIMLDVHEPIKDTGIRRTNPNMMTREGARGQEWNAWSPDGGNPPEHTTIIPFTRLLAGPFDFTPGIFDLLYEGMEKENRVNSTLATQLALYVIIYSPLQMAADLPENYEGQPAFKFIKDVPVDWEVTKVLHAKIGDYVTVVRKDRYSDDWYLGSITDENGRTLEVALSFLDPGRKYVAEVYRDGEGADWKTNPLVIDITELVVDSNTKLELKLAPGGGQAIRFHPTTEDDIKGIEHR
jgi:alpha-glucosidase